MSNPRSEETFVKNKLEEQLNVSIRHNTNGNDPPDLEFKLNGDLIGVEVMQVMKNMSDGNSKRRLEIELAKTIYPCLEAFEKKYARDIRNRGEKRCFGVQSKWGAFLNRSDDSIKTFNAIRDRIQKTVTQGLKVLFELPEVKKEKFFSDPLDGRANFNLRSLNELWAGRNPSGGVPVCGGKVYRVCNGAVIEIDEGFCLYIIDHALISDPGDKLFDDLLEDYEDGSVTGNKELTLLYNSIQKAMKRKKKTCMKKLGQRRNDKYNEMWLYLYDDINPKTFPSKRKQIKSMLFDFEGYWSKVCLFTDLFLTECFIFLRGDQKFKK